MRKVKLVVEVFLDADDMQLDSALAAQTAQNVTANIARLLVMHDIAAVVKAVEVGDIKHGNSFRIPPAASAVI